MKYIEKISNFDVYEKVYDKVLSNLAVVKDSVAKSIKTQPQ